MAFIDKSNHPKYEPNNVYTNEKRPTIKKDAPYLLEHVYDIEKKKYVKNNKMCCYYSPTGHHKYCLHKNDCLFKRSTIWESYMEFQEDASNPYLHDLLDNIWIVKKRINDLKMVNNSFSNGDILYHPFLDDCYDIQIKRTDNGRIIDVTVADNFKERVRTELKKSEMELRDLKRSLYRLR